MPDALTFLQLGLSAVLLATIVERARYLFWLAPLSGEGLKHVLRAIEQGAWGDVEVWAREVPGSHVGQILRVVRGTSGERGAESASGEQGASSASGEHRAESVSGAVEREEALAELLFDLQARALARLRLLRVGATIASTVGLMIGILRIRGGVGAPAGLLALEAGLPEKIALGQALFSMGVGVATSAVCFYAVGVLRDGAREVLVQGTKVGDAVRRALG